MLLSFLILQNFQLLLFSLPLQPFQELLYPYSFPALSSRLQAFCSPEHGLFFRYLHLVYCFHDWNCYFCYYSPVTDSPVFFHSDCSAFRQYSYAVFFRILLISDHFLTDSCPLFLQHLLRISPAALYAPFFQHVPFFPAVLLFLATLPFSVSVFFLSFLSFQHLFSVISHPAFLPHGLLHHCNFFQGIRSEPAYEVLIHLLSYAPLRIASIPLMMHF